MDGSFRAGQGKPRRDTICKEDLNFFAGVYVGGQFNGHRRDGRNGLFCYRGGAQFFDVLDSDLDWLPKPVNLDRASWAQAARAPTDYCRMRRFAGGFMNGHHFNGRSGVVCQGG